MTAPTPRSTRSPRSHPLPADEGDARCPACGSTACVVGTIGGHALTYFMPSGLRFWTLGRSTVPITQAPRLTGFSGTVGLRGLQACTGCGLVWTHVDPTRLRDVVEHAGKPELRAALAPSPERPRDRK